LKEFFIAGHPIADLEIKIEIRDKMMMVLFIQKKITLSLEEIMRLR
jgi:hypothetical protein